MFAPVPLDAPMRGVRVNDLARDRDGAVWLAMTGLGLVRYCGGECEFFGPTNAASLRTFGLASDRGGRRWGIAGRSLRVFERGRRQSATNVPALAMPPVGLAAAQDGGLWVATRNPQEIWEHGTRVHKLKDGHWAEELGPYPWPQDTKRTALLSMVEDSSTRLWVGLGGAGGFGHEPGTGWRRPAVSEALNDLVAGCLAGDDEGSLRVGGANGELHQVRSCRVTTLRLPPTAEQHVVLAACATRDRSSWVATDGAGAFRYRAGEVSRYDAAEGLTNSQVRVIYEDRQTNLWVGTRTGSFRRDRGRFKRVAGPRPWANKS